MSETGHRRALALRLTAIAVALVTVTAFLPYAFAAGSPPAHARPKRPPRPTPIITPSPSPAPTPTSPATGFVGVSGGRLVLNGQPYRFTGLNIYNANSRWTCWYDMQSGSVLADSLTAIGPGQEAIRAWFFDRLARWSGVRDWTAFDNTIAVARQRGIRVVATLANQWGDCENDTGDPVYKGEAWYRDGYRATYRPWVQEIVTRYRDEPAILAWQLINEAEALTEAGGTCSATAEASVEAWASDMAALVKSIDTNHLLSLGTIGSGQCGTSTGQSFERLHAIPAIDLCEYHDYRYWEPMPGDQWNGLATRLTQCAAIGKPMFAGEVGIASSSVGGLAARADAFEAKFAAQFAAGVAGILIWDWRTAEEGGSTGGGYEVGPGDPALALLGRY